MKTKRRSRGAQILAATERHAFDTVAEAVAVGEQVAKQLAAVDTGYMREHTMGESDGQGHGKLESDVTGRSPGTPYNFFIEHGTSKMAARPFLRPGSDAARQYQREHMKIKAR